MLGALAPNSRCWTISPLCYGDYSLAGAPRDHHLPCGKRIAGCGGRGMPPPLRICAQHDHPASAPREG